MLNMYLFLFWLIVIEVDHICLGAIKHHYLWADCLVWYSSAKDYILTPAPDGGDCRATQVHANMASLEMCFFITSS